MRCSFSIRWKDKSRQLPASLISMVSWFIFLNGTVFGLTPVALVKWQHSLIAIRVSYFRATSVDVYCAVICSRTQLLRILSRKVGIAGFGFAGSANGTGTQGTRVTPHPLNS
ncbi:MAG: hypothetical protein DHS20C11_25420 [Lysobacteraceae bacterium]|nr:MAG: hypothetical protein DHS20C11_25420 [Xanthomonadaceae bacterium]